MQTNSISICSLHSNQSNVCTGENGKLKLPPMAKNSENIFFYFDNQLSLSEVSLWLLILETEDSLLYIF